MLPPKCFNKFAVYNTVYSEAKPKNLKYVNFYYLQQIKMW